MVPYIFIGIKIYILVRSNVADGDYGSYYCEVWTHTGQGGAVSMTACLEPPDTNASFRLQRAHGNRSRNGYLIGERKVPLCIASFPSLSWLQFLITCSMQKLEGEWKKRVNRARCCMLAEMEENRELKLEIRCGKRTLFQDQQ